MISPLSRVIMIALMVATIVLGVYPQPILECVETLSELSRLSMRLNQENRKKGR